MHLRLTFRQLSNHISAVESISLSFHYCSCWLSCQSCFRLLGNNLLRLGTNLLRPRLILLRLGNNLSGSRSSSARSMQVRQQLATGSKTERNSVTCPRKDIDTSFTAASDDDDSSAAIISNEILVIGAGLPRTGTSSFVAALDRLDMVSYHMKEGILDTPGHLDAWYQYYKDGNVSSRKTTLNNIFGQISIDGLTASADAPALSFHFEEQMNLYPNAKVVLTVRSDGDGEARRRSMADPLLRIGPLADSFPFSLFPSVRKMSLMNRGIWKHLGTNLDDSTGNPIEDELPEAYHAWNQHVMETVPPERLLILTETDGWEPLCEFLSPQSEEEASWFRDILKTGEEYPRINEKFEIRFEDYKFHTAQDN